VGRKRRFLFARVARRLDRDAEPIGVERIGSMEIEARGARAILAQVERPYERSRLFEWMLAHHDEVIGASGGRRIEWRLLCDQFESAGWSVATERP
jgi:hypothetical protein